MENLCFSLSSGHLLLQYILKPLISHPALEPVPEEQPDVFILRFRSQELALDESSPMEVFDKIKLVFEVLHKHLLSMQFLSSGVSYDLYLFIYGEFSRISGCQSALWER